VPWVFGQVLEVATIARVAREIDAAPQKYVESPDARFPPEHRAALARQRRIEARAYS
jgi:hypothetical protein